MRLATTSLPSGLRRQPKLVRLMGALLASTVALWAVDAALQPAQSQTPSPTVSLVHVKGNALFPLSFYWKNGRVKVSLAVGKGKVQFDKREDLKKRDSEREVKRATMHRLKGK